MNDSKAIHETGTYDHRLIATGGLELLAEEDELSTLLMRLIRLQQYLRGERHDGD